MPSANDKVADQYIAHSVDMLRVSEGMRGDVLSLLTGMEHELVQKINAEDLVSIAKHPDKMARFENKLKETQGTIASTYRTVDEHVADQLLELADVSHDAALNIIGDVFNGEVATTALTRHTLENLASEVMIQGSPASDWWGKQASDTAQRFMSQVRLGMGQGETNDQIVKRIRGTKTGKMTEVAVKPKKGKPLKKKLVPEYGGGVMDVSKREATALVRTAVQTVNNQVQQTTFDENQDVLSGKQLLVTLDGRTSPICQARSGGAWDFEGNPLPSSKIKIPFPGPPPYHFNCRSILIPITKSWEDLIGQKIPGLEEIPPSTQASMDGQVAGDMSYEDWLKTKDEPFQRKVLGEAKYDLWKAGKLRLQDMVDQSGNPLSIAQLKAKAAGQKVPPKATKPAKAPPTAAPGTVTYAQQQEEKKKQAKGPTPEQIKAQEQAAQEQQDKKIQARVDAAAAAQVQQQVAAKQKEVDKAIADKQAAELAIQEYEKRAEELLAKAEKRAAELAAAKAKVEAEAKAAQEQAAKAKAEAEAQAKLAAEAQAKADKLAAFRAKDAERVRLARQKKKEAEAARAAAEAATAQATQEAAKAKVDLAEQTKRVADAPPPFPSDTSRLKLVKRLGGSTGAELVEDEWGQRFVRKAGASPDHLREEAHAEAAYRALGVPVPDSKVYETDKGPVKLAKFIEGRPLASFSGAEREEINKELRSHFVADALLGNWDVVGMEADNILVGKDGVPYRIDVGGSLRYRAQGGKKTDMQWSDHPVDLYTLRDKNSNPQTASVFGATTHKEVVDQAVRVLGRRRELLDALPKELRERVGKRLDNLQLLVNTTHTLTEDNFKWEYADDFTRHQMKLRHNMVTAVLPKQLELTGDTSENKVVDENGNDWDHLRGSGSLIERFAKYLESEGLDHSIISGWSDAQGGSSYSSHSMAVKMWFASRRDVDVKTTFYWGDYGEEGGVTRARENLAKAITKFGAAKNGKSKFEETMSAEHALMYELFRTVDLGTINAAKGTIRVIRTETTSVMRLYHLKPGDQGKVMPRGPADSFSMFRPVLNSEITVQDMPIHRVLGTYMTSLRPGGNGGMFLGDGENEIICMSEGIPFDYVQSKAEAKALLWGNKPIVAAPARPVPPTATVPKPPVAAYVAPPTPSWHVTPPAATKPKKPAADVNTPVTPKMINQAAKLKTLAGAKKKIGEPSGIPLWLPDDDPKLGTMSHFLQYKGSGGKIAEYDTWKKTYFWPNGNIKAP